MVNLERLREELIQVAAVATAIVEDIDNGVADTSIWGLRTHPVLAEVFTERQRQDENWGPQHHDPFAWLMILLEEVGEAVEEVQQGNLKGDYIILQNARLVGERARQWLREHFEGQS